MLPRKDQYAKIPGPMPSMLVNPYISPTKPNDEQNYRYFNECNKLYYTAYCIKTQMNQFSNIKNTITDKIVLIEKNIQDIQRVTNVQDERTDSNKPRRFRRTNNMIQKPYRCQFDKCDKIYASEGSLQQHIKLKHEKNTRLIGQQLKSSDLKFVKIKQSQLQQEDREQDQDQYSAQNKGQKQDHNKVQQYKSQQNSNQSKNKQKYQRENK